MHVTPGPFKCPEVENISQQFRTRFVSVNVVLTQINTKQILPTNFGEAKKRNRETASMNFIFKRHT